MPNEIDVEKLNEAQSIDLAKPPVRPIPFLEYPRAVYLHPKDKTKEHKSKVVQDAKELAQALKEGWRKDAHIPVDPEPEQTAAEYETSPVVEKAPEKAK